MSKRKMTPIGSPVVILIEGISPMVQHRFSASDDSVPQSPKEESPAEKAQRGLYLGPKGEFGVPLTLFSACLRKAGRIVCLPGSGPISSATKTKLNALAALESLNEPEAEFLPFEGGVEWEIDEQRYNFPHPVARPRFERWSFRFRIRLLDKKMTPELARQLIETAGRTVGLGVSRPEMHGTMGRFRIAEWRIAE